MVWGNDAYALKMAPTQYRDAVVAHDGQLVAAGITTVLDSLAIGYAYDGGQRARNPLPLTAAIDRARAVRYDRPLRQAVSDAP